MGKFAVKDLGYPGDYVRDRNLQYRKAQEASAPVVFEFYHKLPPPSCEEQVQSCSTIFVGGNTFLFICHDITELKNLEKELRRHKERLEEAVRERTAELEESIRVKSRFLANMSHGMLY